MINQTRFVYDIADDACFIQVRGQSLRELTIKGSTDYQGIVNGTWFQVDNLTNHWISFRKDRFRLNTWEAFYKCVQGEQTTYYRRLLQARNTTLLIFSFGERDEWIKDQNGKWKSKS